MAETDINFSKKDFNSWMEVKSAIQNKSHKQIFYKEGDVYWASIGLNIGSAIIKLLL